MLTNVYHFCIHIGCPCHGRYDCSRPQDPKVGYEHDDASWNEWSGIKSQRLKSQLAESMYACIKLICMHACTHPGPHLDAVHSIIIIIGGSDFHAVLTYLNDFGWSSESSQFFMSCTCLGRLLHEVAGPPNAALHWRGKNQTAICSLHYRHFCFMHTTYW